MTMNPCTSQFVFGLILGGGSLGLIQAAVIWWLNRMPKVPTPDGYHTICTDCTVRGSGAGRP